MSYRYSIHNASKSYFGDASNCIGPLKINIKVVSSVIPDQYTKYDWNPSKHLREQDI